MLVVFLMTTVFAHAFDDGRYSFTITKQATDTETGEVTLYAKKGETYSGKVSFPSVAYNSATEKWYDVTAIGNGVFQNNQEITELDMDDKLLKIKRMGENAFAGCVSLKKILIHGNIETVGDGAFRGCTSLEDVTIGYGVVNFGSSSGYGVFQGCTSLKTIEIPYTVKYLGSNTFSGCTSLVNITLNSGLQNMGDRVFDGCSSLPLIVIPNSVEKIGQYCFAGCSNLTKATLGGKISEMGDGLFKNDTKLAEVTIQDGCSVISSYTFQGCLALKEIVIPGSVKWIQQTAFAGCTKLESVTIGEGALYLGSSSYSTGVFDGCTSLKNVILPSTLINIHHYAFRGCSSLEKITLNEGLQYMGERVFDGCSALQSIVIPNSVAKIGQYCFAGCSSLTQATLGAKISEMGESLFKNDAKLAEVTIKDGCSIISSYTFQGCLALKEIVIPGSVEWIQQTAFAGCTKLESVTIEEGVLYLGSSSYSTGVFEGCTQLWKVQLPSTLQTINHYTFRNCPNLRRITCYASTLPTLGSYVWNNSAQPKATLYVPESALTDYQASTNWNGFKNIWPIGMTGGEDMYGECDLVDVPSNSPYFDAAAFLCERGVLSGVKNNGNLVDVGSEITRAQIAKSAFYGLYLLNGVQLPNVLVSRYFPTCYEDLNTLTADNEYYYEPARALLYLDYGDGVTPFDRNRLSFNPDGEIERIHVLKVLMETFNIAPDVTNTNNPFPNDEWAKHLLANQPRKFGYLRKAVSLGIVDSPTTDDPEFRPYEMCTRGDAFLWLYRIMKNIEAGTKNYTMPVPTEEAYFEPLNMTLKTLALGLNFQMGNFNHYTKSSFAISGTVPLTFAHTYNSYHTAIDDVFFGQRTMEYVDVTYRPLSAGWSHTYDCYVTMVGTGSARRAIVHWGDGSIHVYKPSGSGYKAESIGVYDNLSVNGSVATIKTKGQSVYKFEQLEGGDSPLYYMTEVSDRNSNTLTVRYTDGQHGMKVVSSVTDGTRQLTFDYLSGTNLVSSVTDPLSRKILFTYTYNKKLDEYFLTKFTDAKGNVTNYTYGDNSKLSTARLLTKIQLPKGNYIQNQYDLNRRLTETVSGTGNTPTTKTSLNVAATYGEDKDPFTTSQITVEREGITSTYNYEMNHNNTVTRMTGNLDLETTMSYDDNDEANPHLPVAMQSNATTVDNIKYDKRGNVLSITVSGNNGVGSLTRTMTYDDMNNLTSITDAKGNKTTLTYDARGNLVKVEAPEGVVTSKEVDDRGLTTKTINPMGVETQYQYNGYGNMIHALLPVLNLKTTVEYDAVSRVTAAYDALSRKTSYVYDNNDNLLTVTDANSKSTTYTYDKNDNMTGVTNASGRTTSLTYDNATDWLTSVAFGGSTKKYEYNKDGSLKAYVKPDGTRLDYTYDELGRVKNDGVNEYVYDSKMRVESVSTPQSKLTFGYDGFNRTTMVDYEAGSTFNTVRYEYDDNSNVTAIEYPNGQRVTYAYDKLNRMTSMTDWKGNTVSYSYRKDSKPQEVTYPNGMITKYVYDEAGRLVGKETKIPGATPGDLNQNGVADVKDVLLLADCILGKNLDYLVYEAADLNGDEKIDVSDMVMEIELITKGNEGEASALHRALREAGYKDLASYSFKLDNVGNIVEQEAIEPFKAIYEPAAQLAYSYDKANRITRFGNTSFEFDANGNTTKRTEDNVAELYTWNKSDQLVNADGVEIEYDPMGLIRRYGDTEYTVSVLGNGDVLSDSKTGNSYIYGAGLEARIDKSGNVSYYVTDMRGSVIAIVDMDGKVTHRYQYDDFGRVVQSEEKDFNPFRYVGKYGVMYNTDTHYYMRARHYDPTIGRFLSEDPIWSTNLYPYCDNNPIMGIDPRGEAGLDAVSEIILAKGVGVKSIVGEGAHLMAKSKLLLSELADNVGLNGFFASKLGGSAAGGSVAGGSAAGGSVAGGSAAGAGASTSTGILSTITANMSSLSSAALMGYGVMMLSGVGIAAIGCYGAYQLAKEGSKGWGYFFGGSVGALGGGIAGAAAAGAMFGATVGSTFPVAGTIVGAALGGLVGVGFAYWGSSVYDEQSKPKHQLNSSGLYYDF